ncbi:2-polyprenyl-3-methyl-6-methoxy-1,4-benzoquinone monooxygenase [Rivibacter subsaxonicus]|uniref:3-demethoxyubiquinol 3-hydroxylase n=1 Tax=Rivibacter subsaxonicus TaxID=457575 RepID=A0A4Q7VZR1_9BURK|nr:2-polyprenyl-3-methyl-6-methoxy-1,4-benzoquinone monooxygenase [Rivibacter subsaxonicus]RZU02058.1 ubiquinone biosynthesis monooxygenase Coq7 [Rivibacter subsaxonicus]
MSSHSTRSASDHLIAAADNALRTLFGSHSAARPYPVPAKDDGDGALPAHERAQAAALMRVNHVGEVCAQALYQAQALATRNPALKAHYDAASRDETDHLAWTEKRIAELGGRTSWLNPLWYAGAFGIGLLAGRAGDGLSLGFVVETERQVEQHLNEHLDRLPSDDRASRAVVTAMRDDEARHALDAERAGAIPLPAPARWVMRGAAKVMTTTAHYL